MHIAAIYYSYFLLGPWRYSYKTKPWKLWTDLKCWYLDYLGYNHTVHAGQQEQSVSLSVSVSLHSCKAGPAWPISSPSMARCPTEHMKARLWMSFTCTLGKPLTLVSHSILSEELSAHGSGGPGVHWVKELPGWPSQEWWWMVLHSAAGLSPAPQGSVLGQVIFNTFVDDLDKRIEGTLSHSADDTMGVVSCWRVGRPCKRDLDRLNQRAKANGMSSTRWSARSCPGVTSPDSTTGWGKSSWKVSQQKMTWWCWLTAAGHKPACVQVATRPMASCLDHE